MTIRNARVCWVLLAVAGVALGGCGDDAETSATTGGVGPDAKATLEGYATLVHGSYEDSLDRAGALKTAVDALVASPTAATLDGARAAWNDARPAYLQTEAYRFYGGPIDDEATGPEGRINGWPLDEVYIDYVEGDAAAGIINRAVDFPTIDKALISDLNEKDGEKNLSAGFHAIEFLLWGQDLSVTGPGARPHTDYVVGAGGTAANQDRRGAYLKAAAELLVDDLHSVEDAWEPGEENYASSFVALDPQEGLRRIVTGMGSLAGSELVNERINNAYETKDQEEEHSCFSDTTHVDHKNDAIGIQNVYLGRYGSLDVQGVDELVRAKDAALDARMQADLQAAVDAIDAIPEPFDQAILDDASRAQIKTAIDALRALTDTTVEVATVLGITINLE
jgi:putative iron-regulated protein